MVLETTTYRLRTGGPAPKKGQCVALGEPVPTTSFVLQTFLAERIVARSCEDQDELLCSNDMQGLGGNYVSASYTAQRFVDQDTKEIIFQEQKTFASEFISEDEVPGVANL